MSVGQQGRKKLLFTRPFTADRNNPELSVELTRPVTSPLDVLGSVNRLLKHGRPSLLGAKDRLRKILPEREVYGVRCVSQEYREASVQGHRFLFLRQGAIGRI